MGCLVPDEYALVIRDLLRNNTAAELCGIEIVGLGTVPLLSVWREINLR